MNHNHYHISKHTLKLMNTCISIEKKKIISSSFQIEKRSINASNDIHTYTRYIIVSAIR